MYVFKDSKSGRTSKVQDLLKRYNNFNNVFVHEYLGLRDKSTVDKGGVSRGRSLAVGNSVMWKVTWDLRHVM